jgi:hypothetical protein
MWQTWYSHYEFTSCTGFPKASDTCFAVLSCLLYNSLVSCWQLGGEGTVSSSFVNTSNTIAGTPTSLFYPHYDYTLTQPSQLQTTIASLGRDCLVLGISVSSHPGIECNSCTRVRLFCLLFIRTALLNSHGNEDVTAESTVHFNDNVIQWVF